MPDEDPILVETRDGKMFITLNRPEVLNAQNDPLRAGLIAALDRFEADDQLGVALVMGSGRAFSAGADLKEGPSASGGRARFAHFDRLDRCRKPLIACIHGYAVGGGLELALCCDIRVATEDALLGTPEPRTIASAPAVAAPRLGRLMPLGEALKLMLTSQPISGRRAYDVGLVQEVAPDQEALRLVTDGLADRMLECSPAALASVKQIARTPVELEMSSIQRLESLGWIDGSPRAHASRGPRPA